MARFAFPLLALGALIVRTATLGFSASALEQEVDRYLQAQMSINQFSGSVLIQAQTGKILVRKGYGLANRELNVPNTPETKFRLASVTKSFTAIGIMLLSEQGLLSVDNRLSKY